jgi:F-type H+-transporting ATPase subunit epsilon
MNDRLVLEILTPEGSRVVEDLTSVDAFLVDGSIGIRPGHSPLLAETAPAPVVCRTADGREEELAAGEGIFQVAEDRVTVLSVRPLAGSRPKPVRLLRALLAARKPAGERDEEKA